MLCQYPHENRDIKLPAQAANMKYFINPENVLTMHSSILADNFAVPVNNTMRRALNILQYFLAGQFREKQPANKDFFAFFENRNRLTTEKNREGIAI